MANGTVPPFFQLGRRIAFTLCYGTQVEDLTGEVMDTEVGWIAVKIDGAEAITWVNLDCIARIVVQERVAGPG